MCLPTYSANSGHGSRKRFRNAQDDGEDNKHCSSGGHDGGYKRRRYEDGDQRRESGKDQD